MSVTGELRDEVISLYNQHKDCYPDDMDQCIVGTEFMDYMQKWMNY